MKVIFIDIICILNAFYYKKNILYKKMLYQKDTV
jgi:hypothetical protein